MRNKIVMTVRRLWQDESAQGATEYILLLVVVVGLMMAFKGEIVGIVKEKVRSVGTDISTFK